MEHWPHAPMHWLFNPGVYVVTGATLYKQPLFDTGAKLDVVQAKLFETAARYEWQLSAWSILNNHYHFIATSPNDANTLRALIRDFHSGSAREINRIDRCAGRKVFYQFYDDVITTEKSFLARLKYVHRNAEHHRVIANAENYRWCSAFWFTRTASRAFVRTVFGFNIDHVKVNEP